jgi:deoxycytidylate deaminase
LLQKNISRIVHGRPDALQAERWKTPFGRAQAMAHKRKVALTPLDLPERENSGLRADAGARGGVIGDGPTVGVDENDSCDGVLRWHRRFLAVARMVASWTHDGMPAESCILVRPDRSIASVGFAGFPRGISAEDGGRVLLAVQNALLFSRDHDLGEATAYCWPAPNVRAMAHLIQDRIRRVVVPGGSTGIPLLGESLDESGGSAHGLGLYGSGTRRDGTWTAEIAEAARILVLAGGSIMSVAS